jgi:Fe-S-cluster containining protein
MEIKGKCVCLSDKNLCTIRAKWPYTCAVYPFNLTMDGQLIHSVHCKGLGHGKVVDIKKWTKRVYKERRKAGMPVPDDYKE